MTIAQSQLERMESITRMIQRRTRINEIIKTLSGQIKPITEPDQRPHIEKLIIERASCINEANEITKFIHRAVETFNRDYF